MPYSKVHISDLDESIEQDASYENAVKIVAEALAQGRAVIDKRNGTVVDKLSPGINDIMIVTLVEGG